MDQEYGTTTKITITAHDNATIPEITPHDQNDKFL